MTLIFLADLVCLIVGCILTSYFFRSFLIVKNPQTGIEAICKRTTYVPNGLKSPVLDLDVYNCSTPEEPERCYIGARRFMGLWKYFYYGNDTSTLWDDSVYFSGITFTVFVAGSFVSFWWLGYTWYYGAYCGLFLYAVIACICFLIIIMILDRLLLIAETYMP